MPGERQETEMVNWRPVRDLERAMDEMEETYEDVFGRPFFPVTYSREPEVRAWSPATEIFDNVDSYIVRLEVPGVSKDDIEVTATENSVTVSGDRKTEQGIEGENFTLCERCYGPFMRTLTFETPIDPDRIRAWLENGILRLEVPIMPEAVGKQVRVTSGAQPVREAAAQPRAMEATGQPVPPMRTTAQPAPSSQTTAQSTARPMHVHGEPVNQGWELRETNRMTDEVTARGNAPIRDVIDVQERAARILTDSRRPIQSKGEVPGESESRDEEEISNEENARQSRMKPTTRP